MTPRQGKRVMMNSIVLKAAQVTAEKMINTGLDKYVGVHKVGPVQIIIFNHNTGKREKSIGKHTWVWFDRFLITDCDCYDLAEEWDTHYSKAAV